MGDRMPRATGSRVLNALERAGWYKVRQRGSHVMMRHPARPDALIVIPVHAGQDVPEGTMRRILRESGLTADELRRLL